MTVVIASTPPSDVVEREMDYSRMDRERGKYMKAVMLKVSKIKGTGRRKSKD